MEEAFVTGRKDDEGNEDSELRLKKLVRKVNPWQALILSVKGGKSLVKNSFRRSISGISSKIPGHVVTFDEKYLRRCLDLIQINAAKAAQCNMSSVNTGILADGLNSTKIRDEDACDFGRFVFDCPLDVETDSVVIGPVDPWVVGSIMGSRSMANILKSPLLKKFGALDVDAPSSNDDFISSPGGFMNCSSNKLGSEAPVSNTREHGSESVQKRLVSVSSSNSTCSDQSFPSTTSQGMLRCTWKGGIPYFVFSLDNQGEVYVANLSMEGSAGNKGLSYTYLFRSFKGSRMEHGISENELRLVGKMKVSTCFSIGPGDSNIVETEFVLFGGNGTCTWDLQTSSHDHRKNKVLTRKVSQVFKSGPLSKQRTMPRFCRSVSLIGGSSFDQCHDTINNSDALDGTDLLEEQLPLNSELFAIVSRDHFPENPCSELGGWGLNFLRRTGVKQKVDPLEAPVRSACARDTGDCSTSMDIIVPAGIHGGPRIRNGGPSSLVERWSSGGHCDCGGWDLGCPLTVLKARSSKGGSSPSETSLACKLFNFFIQGSDHSLPTLSISNVHDGLYFIHFQPTLSALQSFSVAVAYIHTQSPTLRPKNVQQSR